MDDVIDRLSRKDGLEWLKTVWSDLSIAGYQEAAAAVLGGDIAVTKLESIKEALKKTLRETRITEVRLAGLMQYFAIVAAALRHHQTKITSQPDEEVAENLVDLAAVLPEEWADLFQKAAQTLTV